jgi:hypothetical protein
MAKDKKVTPKTKADPNIITDFEKTFIQIYINMNFNGRLAYKQLKPLVTTESADALASKLLSSVRVKDYLALKLEQIRIKEEIKLEFIVGELTSIVYDVKLENTERDGDGRITSKPDRRSAIQALQLLSKIAGFETKKVDITSKGESINPITWIEKKTYDNEDGSY